MRSLRPFHRYDARTHWASLCRDSRLGPTHLTFFSAAEVTTVTEQLALSDCSRASGFSKISTAFPAIQFFYQTNGARRYRTI